MKSIFRAKTQMTHSGNLPVLALFKGVLVFSCLLFLSVNVTAQTAITGTVNDENGQPISGVSVAIKGASKGTATDAQGRYSLNGVASNATLIFSSVGFLSREVPVSGKSVVDMVLAENVDDLKNVVVIGYGTQSRESVTGAISKLDNKVLQSVPYTNAASALQGTLAGVRVQSTSGQPGAAPRVIVRGGTSINNPNGAAPLYIIDGIIRTDMNNIAATDIESIQVLKDAASTAIYGARASNGVVIISTKSGKPGKTTVNYRYDFGVSKQGKMYELASPRDFLTLARLGQISPDKFPPSQTLGSTLSYGTGNDLTKNTAYTTQYLTPENEHKLQEGWESMPDPLDPSRTLIFKGTDFQRLAFQTALSHNHFAEVTGGTDKATFNAGIGYLKSEGPIITTKYDRLSFNLNGTLKVRDNLKFFGRLMYSNSNRQTPPSAYDFVSFYRNGSLPPVTKYTFEDGSLAPGANSFTGNPIYFMNNYRSGNTTDNLTMSAGANWSILPGLSFDPQVSIYNVNGDAWTFQPSFWDGPLTYVDSRDATASNTRWRQKQLDAPFTYNKIFGASHNLSAKAGFSYFGRQQTGLSAMGRNASTDLIPTLNASALPVSVNSTISDMAILGYFSRINYDFDQKYLFSLNLRYDGASNLGEKNKWGFFPGVSVGWNLHKENFWQSLTKDKIDLKLRVSYGVNGNVGGLNDFASQGSYAVGGRYNGVAAIRNSVIPNMNLKWEQSKTVNFGTDIGLFSRRVNMMFDYFRRVTDNLITTLPLPRSTGFSNILTNLGSLENRGVEFELNAQITNPSAAFQWNVSFNIAKIKNKILKLPSNGVENNRVGGIFIWDSGKGDYVWKGGLQEGGTMGDMFDRRQIGIYATDEEALSAPTDMYISIADKTKYGGDVNWQDTDGNGIIDSRDQVYMGNMYPDLTGGFSNTISYKNFSLYARLDYTTGHNILNWGRLFFEANLSGDNTMTQRVVERSWKKQGDITDVPRYYDNGHFVQRNAFNGTKAAASSEYNEKGDFLAIREVTLSYNFSSALLQRLRMNNLRLNVTGNNLHYFTKYMGLNPEEGGLDDGRYAMPKTVIVGLSISF